MDEVASLIGQRAIEGWCCEKGEALKVPVCPECDATSRAYSKAARVLDEQPVPDEGRSMTEEHARAILQVLAEDKRLPQPTLDEVGHLNVVATNAEASEIARRVWWKTKLFSMEGLAHLFPGLQVPKVRQGALPRSERKHLRGDPSNPSSAPRTDANRAARRRAARLAVENPSV